MKYTIVTSRLFSTLLVIFISMTCAVQASEKREKQNLVSIFYGTDRNVTGKTDAADYFDGDRGPVQYGVLQATLAKTTTVYDEFLEEDVVSTTVPELVSLEPLKKAGFFSRLNQAIEASKEKALIVFIHGYKRSFEDVASNAALFASRVNYQAPVVIWSWPSRANPAAYLADLTNMHWSLPHIEGFLLDIFHQTGAKKIHLMGHSLGAFAFATILSRKDFSTAVDPKRIGEVVFMAPDIDYDIFVRDMAPKIRKLGLPITMYVSRNDQALQFGSMLHGSERLGDASDGVHIIDGIETIDATHVNEVFLGHSYYRESIAVTRDIGELLNKGNRAAQRNRLLKVKTDKGNYWIFK